MTVSFSPLSSRVLSYTQLKWKVSGWLHRRIVPITVDELIQHVFIKAVFLRFCICNLRRYTQPSRKFHSQNTWSFNNVGVTIQRLCPNKHTHASKWESLWFLVKWTEIVMDYHRLSQSYSREAHENAWRLVYTLQTRLSRAISCEDYLKCKNPISL